MNRVRSRVAVFLAVLALMLSAATPSQAAATTFRDSITVPYDVVLYNACTGEDVALTGELSITAHTTIDGQGGIHSKFTLVPHNVRGTGLSSGITYKAVGGARSTFNADADFAPLAITSTSMFNLVSQGSSDNFQVRYTFHLTVNANGELTAVVDNFTLKCTG